MSVSFSPVGGAFLVESPYESKSISTSVDALPSETIYIPEYLTAEDRLIGKTADDFLRKEVLPHVERIESGDHPLMHSLMQKAGALGLLGADVPEIYGGLGLPQTTAALIAEKLNYQQSFALTHEAHTVIATLPLLYFGNHDQKSRYLPKLASGEWIGSFALSEANSGSDALALQTKGVLSEDGTHYLLTGEKMWITNTAFADLFTVFGKVDGNKITVFLVERNTPGVSFGREEHKLGMHGTSTRRVILENAAVPIANALEVGKGHYAALCALNIGRFKLEAGAVGGLKEVLAVCTAYAKQRKTFGRPIAEYGLVQHKLAEMAARTFALESIVYRIAGLLENAFKDITADAPDASQQYHRASEEYAIECNIVKVIGSETYSNMTDEAIQIHGGYGYTEEFPVARAWRDQRLLRIGEGANEIVRVAIVNTILRRAKAGRLSLKGATSQASSLLSDTHASEASTSDPLAAIGTTAQNAKLAALILLDQATEHFGDKLLETQEIVAAIADIICSAYALETIYLRCSQLKSSSHSSYKTALLASQVAACDYAGEAQTAVRYCLDVLPNQPESLAEMVLFRANPMQLRRDLAAAVLEAAGYPV